MGPIGLDSFESHRLKRPYGVNFANSRQCHFLFQVKYCNSLLGYLVKGTERFTLLKLRTSQKAPLARFETGMADWIS